MAFEYTFYDFLGNVGTLLVLATYLAVQMDKMDVRGLWYSLLNGFGALLILISLFFAFNLSSFIIEIAWILISAYGLFNYFKSKQP